MKTGASSAQEKFALNPVKLRSYTLWKTCLIKMGRANCARPVGQGLCVCSVASVVPPWDPSCRDSLWPHGLEPLQSMRFPQKNTEWAAIPFSRGSSRPKDWTHISCTAGSFFTTELLTSKYIGFHMEPERGALRSPPNTESRSEAGKQAETSPQQGGPDVGRRSQSSAPGGTEPVQTGGTRPSIGRQARGRSRQCPVSCPGASLLQTGWGSNPHEGKTGAAPTENAPKLMTTYTVYKATNYWVPTKYFMYLTE